MDRSAKGRGERRGRDGSLIRVLSCWLAGKIFPNGRLNEREKKGFEEYIKMRP